MKKNPWKIYALWIAVPLAAGGLSAWLSRSGMKLYRQTVVQPPLSPPDILFPIVWTVLYVLMGIGAARIYLQPASTARSRSLLLFFIQLAFNFFWSILFFQRQLFGLALLWLTALWLLILRMILSFFRVDPLAAVLQAPYLIWVAFAGYLNAGVWMLN